MLNCLIVGVEITNDAVPLTGFTHPDRAFYILGHESRGLSESFLSVCDHVVHIPSKFCLNVATTGSLVLYDRNMKELTAKQASSNVISRLFNKRKAA